MPRTAGHAPVAAIALVAAGLTLGAAVVPAHAEAVVYETMNVEATHPEGGVEWASLDIPTGYEKQRLNRHSVAFSGKETVTLRRGASFFDSATSSSRTARAGPSASTSTRRWTRSAS